MQPTLDRLRRLRDGGTRAALATLVRARGTSAGGREGTRMWVAEDGSLLGAVTLGGCVDARVVAAAEAALASGRPHLCSVDLGEEEAWDLGLTCSGALDVLVEPFDAERAAAALAALETADAAVRAGGRAVVVAPLDGGPARLAVPEEGAPAGTLGDPVLDAAAGAGARSLLAEGGPGGIRPLGQGEGAPEAFYEVVAPPATLVVVGAGAVAMPLVDLAARVGLRTVVVDGRERFATRERFPAADEILRGSPAEIVAALPLHPSTAVVLLAHDYKYDLPVLREVLARDAGYVGLLGSRRRGRAVLDFLAGEGVEEARLRRVRVPVGLDIGARTAAEIALAVLAEVLAVRSGRPGTPLRAEAVG